MEVNHEKKIRSFFAIDLPQDIKSQLEELILELKQNSDLASLRWIRAQNLHLTLQFLKSVAINDIDQLNVEVMKALSAFPAFSLTLKHIHLFPNAHKPKVVALEAYPQAELKLLAELIGKGIISAGYHLDQRPFRAHVSLGRFNFKTKNPVIKGSFPHVHLSPFKIDSVNFFHSERIDNQTQYSQIKTFPLIK